MDGQEPPDWNKEITMFDIKIRLAAASLAVLAASGLTTAGLGAASAAPWEARHDRQVLRQDRHDLDRHDLRMDRRDLRHDMHRSYAARERVADALRFHRYRMIGDPYWVHGRYVVRTHNRFGRIVFVQVD